MQRNLPQTNATGASRLKRKNAPPHALFLFLLTVISMVVLAAAPAYAIGIKFDSYRNDSITDSIRIYKDAQGSFVKIGSETGIPFTGEITISGTWGGGSPANNAVITIDDENTAKSLNVNIILDGVEIIFNRTGDNDACAFAIKNGAKINLTLKGNNTITSGSGRAGIEMDANTILTINGTDKDSLTAKGGDSGAGIGGSRGVFGVVNGGNGGTVIINGGTVTADGGNYGTGIGGGRGFNSGNGGNGGTITINGGTVTALSGQSAGIGGGSGLGNNTKGGDGGEITISGGSVIARSGTETSTGGYGAGIGGGGYEAYSSGTKGNAGKIAISGGTVTASSNYYRLLLITPRVSSILNCSWLNPHSSNSTSQNKSIRCV